MNNLLVSRKKQIFAIRRKRRIGPTTEEIAEEFLKNVRNYRINSLIIKALKHTRYANNNATSILYQIDRDARRKALIARLEKKRLREEKAEKERIDKILAPYAKAWLGKVGRPIVGGMGPRKIVKISLKEPDKVFVHYEDDAFHQVVRWDLLRKLPSTSDMIIRDVRYEKALADQS